MLRSALKGKAAITVSVSCTVLLLAASIFMLLSNQPVLDATLQIDVGLAESTGDDDPDVSAEPGGQGSAAWSVAGNPVAPSESTPPRLAADPAESSGRAEPLVVVPVPVQDDESDADDELDALPSSFLAPMKPAVTGFTDKQIPTVAFLVLGYKNSPRPVWTTAEDKVLIYSPPMTCNQCPHSAQQIKGASAKYINAPLQWWCAQRNYLVGLEQLPKHYPNADFYFLADVDTAVFRESLAALMSLLQHEVLGPSEDAYMGHGYDLSGNGIGKIIMSGGGVLLRGRTLRKLGETGMLRWCIEESLRGAWCWHHLDWVIAECLLKINVTAQGHPAFQQNSCHMHGDAGAVSCHPAKRRKVQYQLLKVHRQRFQLGKLRLNASWARPCMGYDWRYDLQSLCRRQALGVGEAQFWGRVAPSVAFLVWGGEEDASLPLWTSLNDHVLMYFPPNNCEECAVLPEADIISGHSTLGGASQGWWCGQRNYLVGLQQLVVQFPKAKFYFLANSDTLVFRESLAELTDRLDSAVLQPKEDIYIGHRSRKRVGGASHLISSGGGVLIRGTTLRNLSLSGNLQTCVDASVRGSWCWHTLDWMIAECLFQFGVVARSHPAFRQDGCDSHDEASVATCRASSGREDQRVMIAAHHANFGVSQSVLGASWASCDAAFRDPADKVWDAISRKVVPNASSCCGTVIQRIVPKPGKLLR
mmetsp:Transcript_14276/g.50115  ORF Transcript_14276/g.50115 Transcript_14276/m.50115 type:complete len:701 (+) Transcript_14276:88-2190(+)